MAYSKPFLEEVKRRTSAVTLISRFVQLRRAGSNWVARCPFHSEKTPSFTVFPATNSYYCFGCGAGGDVITFVMQAQGLDYREAVEQLASEAGVPVEEDGSVQSAGPTIRKSRLLEINKLAAKFYYACLQSPQGERARSYLLEKRRFTELTVRRFGIGYAPESWDALSRHLLAQGVTAEELTLANLGGVGRKGNLYDAFRNRVMFPVFDLSGEVVAFSGRRLNEQDEPKYINTRDTPAFKKSRVLFGMQIAKNHAEEGLILCEGAPDCIAMQQAGFENAVATLGTAITGEHARLVARFTKRVFLAYDVDKAGRAATLRGINLLEQVGVGARVISLGDGDSKDPDEFIKNHGAEAFRAKLRESVGQVDYRVGEILSRYRLSEPDEKLRCGAELAAYIAALPNRMEREVYADRAAAQLEVSSASFREEVERRARILAAGERKKQTAQAAQSLLDYGDDVNPDKLRYSSEASHEEAVLGILLLKPEFGKAAAEELETEDFATDFNRRLWTLYAPAFAEGNEPDLTGGGELSVREIGTAEGYRAARATLGDNTEQVLAEHIKALRGFREKKSYDEALERAPADALTAYLAAARKKKSENGTGQKGTGK